MTTLYICKRVALPAFGLLLALGGASSAMAQTTTAPKTPSAMSEAAGATTGLGSSHRFKTPAAATAHCPSDTVVWTSRSGKSYHLSSSRYFGTTRHGFYACKMEADTAGFHAAKN
jgi:hypothetical protein